MRRKHFQPSFLSFRKRELQSKHNDLTAFPPAGQNRSRPPRPRQNPLPSIQPAIRQIHGNMVRRRDSHAGHQPPGRPAWSLPRPLSHATAHLPVCLDKIPYLRASPLHPHPLPRPGNLVAPHPLGLHRGRDLRLPDLPARDDPRAPGLRDEQELAAVQPLAHLQPDLQRATASIGRGANNDSVGQHPDPRAAHRSG